MTSPNAKGPAEAATSPSHGSPKPGKDKEMNKKLYITEGVTMPALSRRRMLAGMTIAVIPPAAAAPFEAPLMASIDAFLATALPAERISYHANALQEALAELRPDLEAGWHMHLDLQHPYVMVTPKVVRRAGL